MWRQFNRQIALALVLTGLCLSGAYAKDVALTQDLAVPFVFMQSVSSDTAQPGDTIPVQVAKDTFYNNVLLFKKGTPGVALVAKARPKARHIGPTGQLSVQSIRVEDGGGNAYTLSFDYSVRGNRIIGCDAYYATSFLPLITRYYTPQYIVESLPGALLLDNFTKRNATIKEATAVTAYLPEGETVHMPNDEREEDVQLPANLLAENTLPKIAMVDSGAPLMTDVTPEVIHGYIEKDEYTPGEPIALPPGLESAGLSRLQTHLQKTPQDIANETPLLVVNPVPLSLRRERIRRGYTVIWSYGGGVGNGVFKNIKDTKLGFHNGMWYNLRRNFTDPTRVVQGYWEHGRSVRTNYIAHPLLWSRMGNMLQNWGANHQQTVVWGLIGDIMWKWVIEGTYHAQAPQSELVDFWSVAMSIALRNTAAGKKLAAAPLRYERMGIRHHMSLVPTFTTSISPQGGVRLGTEALWAIH